MMYKEKFAICIKSAGKVLREQGDAVRIPFGSEYSIFLRNLNSVRSLVKVSIDNQPVDDSSDGFVVAANGELNLERFIKNGNLSSGNSFKFIERTGKIEQHRGIGVEDGLIRVEFQYEKVLPKVEDVYHVVNHHYIDHYWPYYSPYYRPTVWSDNTRCFGSSSGLVGSQSFTTRTGEGGGGTCSSVTNDTLGSNNGVSANFVQTFGNNLPQNATYTPTMGEMINEAGITVAGSKSDQQFTMVSSFPLLDEKHVIVLKLLGETAKGKKIVQAVTVKSKQKCPTCGHVNKANAKFCAECGTALEIL